MLPGVPMLQLLAATGSSPLNVLSDTRQTLTTHESAVIDAVSYTHLTLPTILLV